MVRTSTDRSPPSLRPGLGLVAVGAGLLSAWALFGMDDSTLAAVSARIGMIFGAVWLAYPVLVARSRQSWIVIAAVAAVVLFRPRTALFVIPIVAVWLVTAARR